MSSLFIQPVICHDIPVDPSQTSATVPTEADSTSSRPFVVCGPKELADHLTAMDQIFESIGQEFNSLLSLPGGEEINGMVHLGATWVELQKVKTTCSTAMLVVSNRKKRFAEWARLSRDAATKTEAYIQDFVRVIVTRLADSQAPAADKRRALSKFINRKKPYDTVAGGEPLVVEFSRLKRDAQANSVSTLSTIVNPQRAKLATDVLAVKAELTSMNQQYEDVRGTLFASPFVIGVLLCVAGFCAIMACVHFAAPLSAACILVPGIYISGWTIFNGMPANRKRLQEISQDWRPKNERRMEDLTVEMEHVENLATAIGKAYDGFNSIHEQLLVLPAIWEKVADDARKLKHESVNNVDNKEALLTRVGWMAETRTKSVGYAAA